MKRNNTMELVIKHFDELSAQELFEIFKLRVCVFVVEAQVYARELYEKAALFNHHLNFWKMVFHI